MPIMLWRPPVPVRSLFASTRRYSSSIREADPLRILFCGSDDFSIASLRALSDAKRDVPGLIDDIQVAHRPAKPTGRGLKTLREVPIRDAAHQLSLRTHTLDTFTGWQPPFSYNLVIAVSFGLLVPPRILSHATYGGLNVHPSLLPDLRGPAPIEHAILQHRTHTGVSVQTLHPHHFDQGTVLAQTPAPGLRLHKHTTAPDLQEELAAQGAEMLVDVLKQRRYVPPLQPAGWYSEAAGPVSHAPKITKADSFIDPCTHRMPHIMAAHRALGDVWCLLPNGKRLVIHHLLDHHVMGRKGQKGPWLLDHGRGPLFQAQCGRIGEIDESTYEGGKARNGNTKVMTLLEKRLAKVRAKADAEAKAKADADADAD